MTELRKVTIAVAYINLVLNQEANNDLVHKFLKGKKKFELEKISQYLKENFTNDQMIEAAEKFSKEPVY